MTPRAHHEYRGRRFDESRPRPWEQRMTVCIAAACKDGGSERLVLCADWRLSGALGSAENYFKIRVLGKKWYALTSGSESEIESLLNHFRNHFRAVTTLD